MSTPKRVVILTGNETRHQFFRQKVSMDRRFNVIATYCERIEKSLSVRVAHNSSPAFIERLHFQGRTQFESDYFKAAIDSMPDFSNAKKISKGQVNDDKVVAEIESLNADILVCYGASLIKSSLLKSYKNRFLNVHLGLSPYYRGSGTNVWPLINREPGLIGATFMHIDEGIDTGKIIHQIRPNIVLGDGPHSIGNRVIKDMTDTCCEVIYGFDDLAEEKQPRAKGKLYLQKHFDAVACERLYENFRGGIIGDYIRSFDESSLPYIVSNRHLAKK